MKYTSYRVFEDRYAKANLPIEFTNRLAKVLGGRGKPPITQAEVMALAVPAATADALPPSARWATDLPAQERGDLPRDIPVMATTEGPEGTFVLDVETPVDLARRPPGLVGNRGAFAIYVVGETMAPRYEAGELVFLDPFRPASVGDHVVVETDTGAPGDPPRCYLLRKLAVTDTEFVGEQYNPRSERRIPAASVRRVLRVLDWRDLSGV